MSIAWLGVWAIGPATLKEVLTETLDADMTAERLQISVGERIVLRIHDLDPAGAVGMDDGRDFAARVRLDRAVSTM